MKRPDIEQFSVDAMADEFEERMVWQIEHKRERSKQLFSQCMLEYYQRVRDAAREGRPLAFTSVLFWPDLLNSMGLTTFPADQYTIQMIAQGRAQEFIFRGEEFGFYKEACSPHIATVGLAAAGAFPKPDLQYVTAQGPCDSQAALGEALNFIYDYPPIFWLNMPYRDDEETIQYFKEELWDMVQFTEKHTDLKYDEEKLRDMQENARVCEDYFKKIHELRKLIPTPIRSREAFSSLGPRMTSEGRPLITEFMKTQYEEIVERVKNGVAAIPEERHRLVIGGAAPFWCMKLFDWMEEEFGAVIVVDYMNAFPRDPIGDTSDPLDCLARKAIRTNFGGRVNFTPSPPHAEAMARIARECQADSALFFAHFGCRQTCGQFRIVTEALKEIADINAGVIDVDIGNPMIVSESQMKYHIAQYFEALETSQSDRQVVRSAKSVELPKEEDPDGNPGYSVVF
ncbi:MAG: 2-hydroxyacyl-CoA dehydratase family protein [Candidatus Binatia bacterium]|nr:2-hydroxyacyl-CoA dehydratase family protein [Candidatus Binatia bacterium]